MTSNEGKKWLSKNLSKDMNVFEYGTGGSTMYFAKRVKSVISVEHQFNWYLAVKKALKQKGIRNSILYWVSTDRLNASNSKYRVSDPNDLRFKGLSYQKYVTTINKYPDNYFDLVFIDGRARNSCLELAAKKVKNKGYIFLDDSDRIGYLPGKKFLEKYRKVDLNNAAVWIINKTLS